MRKVWLVTGASRGLGLEIAKAALRAGDRVVASSRKREAINATVGANSEHLLALDLDVTRAGDVQTAVDVAVARFGGIDVLVNNAGYGHLGFFEETNDEDVRAQYATNLFGVFDVTRAVLPVMRAARRGHIFNISSLAGFLGVEAGSLYCSTKFALEGFSEALAGEVAPFGIHLTIVEPGPFRTDFLTPQSRRFAKRAVADYGDRPEKVLATFEQRDGKQSGDPTLLAEAIVRLANEATPPLRFTAGTQAIRALEAKLATVRAELAQWRELGISTDFPT